jgi:hypothetical protein
MKNDHGKISISKSIPLFILNRKSVNTKTVEGFAINKLLVVFSLPFS